MKTDKVALLTLNFRRGQRVQVVESCPSNITGYGRIEAEANARPGWYYVRFPAGELVLVQWVYLLAAEE